MNIAKMDLIDILNQKGCAELAEEVCEYRIDTINIRSKDGEAAIGASKMGGCPDLPPEIPYPTMSGYSCKRGEKTERYEKSAMQLVAQINLAELAEMDVENRLPHTGMLYFFWSGEIVPIHATNKWVESIADDLENAAFHKVIWYDGDLSNLKRTAPPEPYYSKYFTEAFEEMPIAFEAAVDYHPLGDELDCDQYEELSKLVPGYDLDNLSYNGSKLFGYPMGGNIPRIDSKTKLLFQYDYGVGCLWSIFWTIDEEDLKNRNFQRVMFEFDMD